MNNNTLACGSCSGKKYLSQSLPSAVHVTSACDSLFVVRLLWRLGLLDDLEVVHCENTRLAMLIKVEWVHDEQGDVRSHRVYISIL